MNARTEESAMFVYAWASTDVGRRRDHNEDSYLMSPDLHLFGVADGMGGHEGGEIASDIAVRSIDEFVRANGGAVAGDPALVLAESVRHANRRVHQEAQARGFRQMGTTTTGVMFRGQRAFIAHVGDSRIYLVRQERILQLSDDHSLVAEQLRRGLITEEQAKTFPWRNVIMRSVGVAEDIDVDVVVVDVSSGDTFLMCSDGLTNLVSDAEINAIVNDNFLHRVPELLIDLANERGGTDNITVVVAYAIAEQELR